MSARRVATAPWLLAWQYSSEPPHQIERLGLSNPTGVACPSAQSPSPVNSQPPPPPPPPPPPSPTASASAPARRLHQTLPLRTSRPAARCDACPAPNPPPRCCPSPARRHGPLRALPCRRRGWRGLPAPADCSGWGRAGCPGRCHCDRGLRAGGLIRSDVTCFRSPWNLWRSYEVEGWCGCVGWWTGISSGWARGLYACFMIILLVPVRHAVSW
jgi:hypothetical protein